MRQIQFSIHGFGTQVGEGCMLSFVRQRITVLCIHRHVLVLYRRRVSLLILFRACILFHSLIVRTFTVSYLSSVVCV
jgi:hypothetical protein